MMQAGPRKSNDPSGWLGVGVGNSESREREGEDGPEIYSGRETDS